MFVTFILKKKQYYSLNGVSQFKDVQFTDIQASIILSIIRMNKNMQKINIANA